MSKGRSWEQPPPTTNDSFTACSTGGTGIYSQHPCMELEDSKAAYTALCLSQDYLGYLHPEVGMDGGLSPMALLNSLSTPFSSPIFLLHFLHDPLSSSMTPCWLHRYEADRQGTSRWLFKVDERLISTQRGV